MRVLAPRPCGTQPPRSSHQRARVGSSSGKGAESTRRLASLLDRHYAFHMAEHTNRLADEASPYLKQHATNPVDWYPWGDEALAKAKAEDKPILLSIGYSACHWCHVMEHESFENE